MNEERRIIKPTTLKELCYAIDLNNYFRDTNVLHLVEYDPKTLMRTGDKVVYQDKILPIYQAEVLLRSRNFENLD